MSSAFSKLSVTIFGESHSEEIGVRIKGLPRGAVVDAALVQSFLDRRKSGDNSWSTPRKEPDRAIFVDGLDGNVITGEVCAVIKNVNARPTDYSPYSETPRPSHADYVAVMKDGKDASLSGGGRFSGRMTAPLCIAGGIAVQLLSALGIRVGAYVSRVGGIQGKSYSDGVTFEEIQNTAKKGDFALTRSAEMARLIAETRQKGDSVGGAIECAVFGMPVGIGDSLFDGLESKISASLFAVPAVKSVEFGLGTGFVDSFGSEVNDAFRYLDGKVITETNNNGGINGGISNGMPITVRVGIKPTPSVSLPQRTVNLRTKENVTITIKGRHDACVAPRAVPAVESAVALAVLDSILENNGGNLCPWRK